MNFSMIQIVNAFLIVNNDARKISEYTEIRIDDGEK